MLTPSSEQENIVNDLGQGKCVVVDAVAGSGKTSTSLFASKRLDGRKFLLLTYNRKLCDETRDKIKTQNIDIK